MYDTMIVCSQQSLVSLDMSFASSSGRLFEIVAHEFANFVHVVERAAHAWACVPEARACAIFPCVRVQTCLLEGPVLRALHVNQYAAYCVLL